MKGTIAMIVCVAIGGGAGLLIGTVAAQTVGIILALAAIAALIFHITTT